MTLLIISPLILTISYKALKAFDTYPKNIFAYFLFIFSILTVLYTLYFGFKTIKVFLDELFKK
ncbi:hypothetical protein [Tenacibaculum sp. C7A-26P2]|uniref:hypothetical protein n=1 Tax=Tenacibaculum sp. C7A-26P2 TaxID=3447504 RepID=UPI003F85DC8B